MKAIERSFLSNDWITFTLLFCLALLFLMKLYKPQRLLGYSIAFFTQSFIEKRAETNSKIHSYFTLLSFLFGAIIISLTISIYTNNISFTNFIFILGLVATYLIIHFYFIISLVKTFEIEKDMRYFLFTKIGYLYTICLWVFPSLIIYLYGFKSTSILSLYILFLLVFRIILILKNNKKLILNNLFYFILYFCTLELAPLLIIYKKTIT